MYSFISKLLPKGSMSEIDDEVIHPNIINHVSIFIIYPAIAKVEGHLSIKNRVVKGRLTQMAVFNNLGLKNHVIYLHACYFSGEHFNCC